MVIGVPCQITWQPSLLPIGLLNEFSIPIGPLFQLQYNFLLGQILLEGGREMQKFSHGPRIGFACSEKYIGG